jgi:hypothetical protein
MSDWVNDLERYANDMTDDDRDELRYVNDMTDHDRDELRNLAEELFGTSNNIPPAYVRELKRYLDTATAKLGLVVNSNNRVAYWIDGCTLGVFSSTGIMDADLQLHPLVVKIIRLDHLTNVNVTVAIHYDNKRGRITASGRRLVIGQDVDLDASPERFLPEKRNEIEHFIDQLLAVVAGRCEPPQSSRGRHLAH